MRENLSLTVLRWISPVSVGPREPKKNEMILGVKVNVRDIKQTCNSRHNRRISIGDGT